MELPWEGTCAIRQWTLVTFWQARAGVICKLSTPEFETNHFWLDQNQDRRINPSAATMLGISLCCPAKRFPSSQFSVFEPEPRSEEISSLLKSCDFPVKSSSQRTLAMYS